MKYHIDYPIHLDCQLKCWYCYHVPYFEKTHPYQNGEYPIKFTVDDYIKWRDTHLGNAEDIIFNVHGGETFLPCNTNEVLKLLEALKGGMERFDMLSNGLAPHDEYKRVFPYKDQIWRIGLTYHRAMIHDKPKLIQHFHQTVHLLNQAGINVYVKELLRVKDRQAIKEHKAFWTEQGIEFKVQDYKGDERGQSYTEYEKYSGQDNLLIDEEYRHPMDRYCECIKGYKPISIRGYDQYSGDVLACWKDPCVVGNIQENWYTGCYNVDRVPGGSVRNVVGLDQKIYRGTYDRDLWNPNEKTGEEE